MYNKKYKTKKKKSIEIKIKHEMKYASNSQKFCGQQIVIFFFVETVRVNRKIFSFPISQHCIAITLIEICQ